MPACNAPKSTNKHEQRSGCVGQNPLDQVNPTDRSNVLGQEKPDMLQVALAPAAIALDVLSQIRRQSFVTAIQIVSEPDFPSGVSHQSRFDEVVAQDSSRRAVPCRVDPEARNWPENGETRIIALCPQ